MSQIIYHHLIICVKLLPRPTNVLCLYIANCSRRLLCPMQFARTTCEWSQFLTNILHTDSGRSEVVSKIKTIRWPEQCTFLDFRNFAMHNCILLVSTKILGWIPLGPGDLQTYAYTKTEIKRSPKLNQRISGWQASICEVMHSEIAKIQESTLFRPAYCFDFRYNFRPVSMQLLSKNIWNLSITYRITLRLAYCKYFSNSQKWQLIRTLQVSLIY